MRNIFEPDGVDTLVARIENLRPDSRPECGKMNAAQMLAHNSLVFEGRHDSYPTMTPPSAPSAPTSGAGSS